MNIPRPAYFGVPQELNLLTTFTLMRLEAERASEPENEPDRQDPAPSKPQPEIVPPKEDGDKPEVRPEIPTLPKTPESERPSMPEVGPSQGLDVVEMPEMPSAPETGVPAQELPGGIMH